ncbi:deazaflavin-dependent oxidoreductase (nitroreductase family) [Williamsia limnetica]|jgi:deazaflavin-dependent oxidoreductase (nitroreductase family)|uniref:Deazaflavin-dependent oxidoreductase (Nitroreductase family) n=1 Tax=Williamsia limnetica TaxID=882452 RepID=A0A318RL63_WILLI|nr:nitroreductase family deazaflavin-dependent oxidoreductase [Williamsia limnetica]PYE16275.1 deazaflavin-dependent oxidoreductase (nitroreductase family) [Williamsia limnetica]
MSTDNSDKQYQPQNLTLRNAEHAERYRATDGAEGHIWNGATCLLLTTTGRKSGQPRETPLIYAQDGDDLVVIASKGGAPKAPNWYENLVVNPEVTVQILAERFSAQAHEVDGEEYTRLWDLAAASWPNYNVYAQRTDRKIPVVVLRRTPAS